MTRIGLIALSLALGAVLGSAISPLVAQPETTAAPTGACSVGERSGAACSGKWIYFAGNADGLDASVWVVRIDAETGDVWYKDGKKLRLTTLTE